MQYKKIVTIGGGTGSFTLLSGLKRYPFLISAIVSMADDGGSTGRLRDELGVLPPGDIRQCLVALSEEQQIVRDLFNYRFESGDLKGHTLGNLLLSALEKMRGDFTKGLDVAKQILKINGSVLPVTQDNTRLFLKTTKGRILKGEREIYESDQLSVNAIDQIILRPAAMIHPRVKKAIEEAGFVIIAPGNIYCSIVPNFLVKGVTKALDISKAKVVYVVNLVNKKGQTDGMTADDYVDFVNAHLGRKKIDIAIINSQLPHPKVRHRYEAQGETLVEFKKSDRENRQYRVFRSSILHRNLGSVSTADALGHRRSLIRHDSNRLADLIAYITEMEAHKNLIREII